MASKTLLGRENTDCYLQTVMQNLNNKYEGKIDPVTCYEGPEEKYRCSFTLSLSLGARWR